MNRRALIMAVTAAALSGSAAASSSAELPAVPPSHEMTGVGLPIIVGGRVRNHVFVVLKLYPAEGQSPDAIKAKEPYLRDALVRAAHRTPFVLVDDWNQLYTDAMSASLIRASDSLIAKGAITRVEVVGQFPRLRSRGRSV